jgi:hypothetical protein
LLVKLFVYEGRIRIFDPEPGDVIYLQDHPDRDPQCSSGPGLVDALEKWRGEGMLFGDVPGRYRITVEEIE